MEPSCVRDLERRQQYLVCAIAGDLVLLSRQWCDPRRFSPGRFDWCAGDRRLGISPAEAARRAAEAGRIVWEGEVAFITPEGIPLYETNPEPSIVTGSFGHFSYADRCKAL